MDFWGADPKRTSEDKASWPSHRDNMKRRHGELREAGAGMAHAAIATAPGAAQIPRACAEETSLAATPSAITTESAMKASPVCSWWTPKPISAKSDSLEKNSVIEMRPFICPTQA